MYPECAVVAIHSALQLLRDRIGQLIEYNRHKEAQSYLALFSFLVAHTLADSTPFSVERRAEYSQWAAAQLEKEVSHAAVVRALLLVFTQVHDDRKMWSIVARDLQVVCGHSDRTEPHHKTTILLSIHEKSVVTVVAQTCHALHCYMDDVDLLLGQMRQLSKVEEMSEQKERWELLSSSAHGFADETYQRLLVVCEVLCELSLTALTGTAVDWLLRALSRVFKQMTAVTKGVYRAGVNPPASFSQLCNFVVQKLTPHTNKFVLYITGADKPEEDGVTDDTMVSSHLSHLHRTLSTSCALSWMR